VRIIAATEKPIRKPDPEYKAFVNMVTLVRGVQLPALGQVPLLDSHKTASVSNVLGSVRNFEIKGRALECDVFFAGTPAGREAAQKLKEGHLTDFSVGFRFFLKDSFFIPPGKTEDINSQAVQGPARIIKKWYLREVSIAPIGANSEAKPLYHPPPSPQMRFADTLLFAFITFLLLFILKGMF
jgi:HK97 family phage prohead protease